MPTRSRFHRRAALLCLLALPSLAGAQAPRSWFPFNGTVNDATAFAGRTINGTPVYAANRFGAANGAWSLNGTTDFIELTTATTNNSAQDLGLKGNFTVMAWIRPTAPNSGDNMVFGMNGGDTGSIHYGLRANNGGKQHMGMYANDLQGTYTFQPNQWYHVAYQFDGTSQRVFVNGLLSAVRATTNTTKSANVRIGFGIDAGRNFEGRVDDAVFYNSALTEAQILDLVTTSDPTRPAVPGDPLEGNLGAAGLWGIREVKAPGLAVANSIVPDSLENALALAYNQSHGTVFNGTRNVLNLGDPQSGLNSGNFGSDLVFLSNTAADDEDFIVIGQAFIQINAENDYTFGFSGDDGARLRLYGKDFTSAVTTAGGNGIDPPRIGDQILFTEPTGNGTVLGVVHLTPGVYFLEHLWFERGGGAWTEVYAAPGAKTAFDGTFRLVGDTAGGGLAVVAPRPIVKYFETSANVIAGGSPSNITLSYDVLYDTSLSINQGVGTVTGSNVTIPSPGTTTTYTLTATRSGQSVTANVTVFVDPPPTILSFAASDSTVATGEPVLLSWNTLGGTSYTLNPGGINVTGNTTNGVGSRTVNPAATTNYTLTVTGTNPPPATSSPLTVTVGAKPVIGSFTVDDASPASGAVSKLSWSVSDFTSLSINEGVGDVTSLPHAFVCPSGSTTYTLSASNSFGTSTAQVTVSAPTAIGISPAGFSVRFVSSSTQITNLATADALLGGANIVNDTTLNGVPGVNYADTGTAGELSGDATFPPGFADDFVMRATATLVVNSGGTYTFGINNDDGGRLRVNGSTLINDDALHGPTTTVGSVTLAPGNHSIEYVFFERGGGATGELFLRPADGIASPLVVTSGAAPITTSSVILNEIMADNDADILVDGDGDAEDWIELYNGTASPVNVGGWFLTDDAALPTKWQFPANTIIPAGGYLIVWASDKTLAPPPGELHANFKLTSAGEYLGLIAANGTTVVHEFAPAFPPQSHAVSWGTFDTEQYTGFFVAPTPGGRNVYGYQGLVGDTSFDVDRGFHTAAFQLSITTATPGATILYTTDGSEPSDKNATNGTLYTGPITISQTMVVRARAVKEGFSPSNVDTQTYLFVDDIVTQNAAHAHALGFPDTSINGQRFEYDMDLAATGGNTQRVKDALRAIPTMSLVIPQKDFSDPVQGIYVNADNRGLERKGSIELINEDGLGGGQFQEDCGIRIRGGFSRSGDNPKHAFRLFFRKTYGAGKLNYPLFQDEGTNEFDGFDLRTSQNYSWAFQNDPKNTFLREIFGRDTQRAMKQPYTRSRYYHLYINGHYWGLYMTQERAEADYAASYLGGVDDDYDTVKSAGSSGGYNTEVTDGTFDEWQTLWNTVRASGAGPTNTAYFNLQGLAADGLTPNASPVLLDVGNLADYLLAIFYTGSFDAPLSTFLNDASNNWFGVRNRVADNLGFQFFVHDAEHAMGTDGDTRSTNRTGPWGPTYGTIGTFAKSNPQYLHEDLAFNAEYRLAFADRAHRALVAPGGALTPSAVQARINERAAIVDTAIDAEAVRWGSASLNKTTWLNAKNALFDWIARGSNQQPANGPGRAAVLLDQLRVYSSGALYPNLDAPVYTQSGNPTPVGSGNVASGFQLAMTNPDALGTIYFTLDGTDPRLPGGTLRPGAMTYGVPVSLNASTTVKARIRNGTEWSALNEATFIVGTVASASNLVVSKLYYNPPGAGDLEEYIEVMNIGNGAIELAGVTFSSGLTFDFSTAADTTLDPGERAVVVKNLAAFNSAFAASLPLHILGEFVGSLDNSGERLALLDATGGTIRDFTYNDKSPWPESPDGGGPALVLIDPEGNPDHGIATNWRASASSTGGGPGDDDRVTYAAFKTANGIVSDTEDHEGDGISAFLEFAFGGSPVAPDTGILPQASVQSLTLGGIPDDYLTISFRRNLGAEELTYAPAISTDLAAWNMGETFVVPFGSPIHNGDGTETVVYRTVDPVGTEDRLFIHVVVSQ